MKVKRVSSYNDFLLIVYAKLESKYFLHTAKEIIVIKTIFASLTIFSLRLLK